MNTERRWRAMGSDIHLIVVGGPAPLADDAVLRLEDLERRWSRFREDSEVSELNRRAGSAVRVSDDTLVLVRRAIDAWRISGGAFDPTILGSLIRAGYDRSFEELGPEAPPGQSLLGLGAADIRVEGDEVTIPAGTGFDPGGIGKGLAADLLTTELLAAGAEGACVNMGGDVRVAGTGPDGGTWTIGIDHPSSPRPVALLGLAGGAVATSTTLKRRWTTDGQPRHHLIDPQTGLPSDTDLVLASVVAGDAWIAEVLAKAVLLAGAAHPFDILGGTGTDGLAVDGAGRVQATSGLTAFLGGVPVPALVSSEVSVAGVAGVGVAVGAGGSGRAGEVGVDSAGGPRTL